MVYIYWYSVYVLFGGMEGVGSLDHGIVCSVMSYAPVCVSLPRRCIGRAQVPYDFHMFVAFISQHAPPPSPIRGFLPLNQMGAKETKLAALESKIEGLQRTMTAANSSASSATSTVDEEEEEDQVGDGLS